MPMNSLLRLFLFPLLFSTTAWPQSRLPFIPLDIPVRDGHTLAADLYATDTTTAKPVILIQTPYNKAYYRVGLARQGGPSFPFDTAKYHYVIVDWRGFYGSSQAAVAGYDRGLDGYDIVEWVASRPWCNGRIGTWGASALGLIQFLTARHRPPHLVCSVPLVKDFKTKYGDYYYGGVFRREHVETLERLGFLSVETVLSQPLYNAVWRALERNTDIAEEIAVPMLLIGGWFDHYPDDVIRAFEDLRARSAPAVRNSHKLLFGPWTHGEVGAAKQGDLDFPDATEQAREYALSFFGYYLWNEKNGYPLRPPVRYYRIGDEIWRDAQDWKNETRDSIILYFRGAALLSPSPPQTERDSATIRFDPRDPSPSCGGARFNPFDPSAVPGPLDIHGTVESRNDVLLFSTDPLDEEWNITGPVRVDVFLSSDRVDTDIGVRLCDVYPDGRSIIMTDGIARSRFREGLEREVPLPIARPVCIPVYLQNLAWTIRKGHRLRVVVASSNYPRFDVNPNTGGPLYVPGDTFIARNTVYFDALRPSRLTFGTDAPTRLRIQSPPDGIGLGPVLPNPFEGIASIGFCAHGMSGTVSVSVHDPLGRRVAVLYEGSVDEAPHILHFDARGLPAGAYFCILRSRSHRSSLVLHHLP
ncbi:MAG: CocE/NonD family hydrolase [Bacteroidota bacterium]|nr:CocE/NonD family hydrolase [Bacteroidota bacterium]